ncbi:MAG: 2-succinyl-5-enolpyruvyl-6-hydroxy-3-cyclohexene-1-carboxylic-acid synthase, partial [Solirubrobacterales bacterium]
MELTNETFAPLRVMVDEFVRLGVRHAVAAPGSRNAPISYALSDRDEIRTFSVLDERSAGFFALGLAKATRTPVVVTCSSGTASANLHPAVIEASHAGVPLIVLTADRPPELRDVGAGQSIDQIKLFGSSVRWFVEAGSHSLSEQTLRHFRALACRAWAESLGDNPGPVHLNLPLRDPLHPVATGLGGIENSRAALGREDGAPWSSLRHSPAPGPDLAEAIGGAKRPLIVVGEQHQPGLAAAIAEFAGPARIPVLADALSQLRREPLTHKASVVSAYDLILRDDSAREHLVPDLVIRVGETPTSKPLRAWLSSLSCDQIVIDPRGVWHEPSRIAAQIWQADPLA